jgi:ABC-type Na+ transport system ATPase subunit NatA
MIEVINITKTYTVQGKKHTVFKDLSLKIESGQRIALMGGNVVGKSTLLRLLCGIENLPKALSILLGSDVDFQILSSVERVFVGKSTIGFLALILNKPVHTFGSAFYINRGITIDTICNDKFTRERSLEELFFYACIEFSRYFDPVHNVRISIEDYINQIFLNDLKDSFGY